DTDLNTPEAFAELVVAVRADTLIRLRDIATVELGPESGDSISFNNLKQAVFLAIKTTPGANPLDVAAGVHAAMPAIKAQFPSGLESTIGYDGSLAIAEAIKEVVMTLVEASAIVIVVIFLFLGNVRATVVPIVTIPLSLVGVLLLLAAIGYSINLLTLLALVLAIGLVVDDAIVVLENIHRHIEEGMAPFDAAIRGAREIVLPIIAMTLTLAAVYAPIGFLGGLTGTLFREFAFTLAGAVIVSGVIALTLSPMMTSRLLKPEAPEEKAGIMHVLDRLMDKFRDVYEANLSRVLENRPVIFVVAAGIIALSALMFTSARRELAPVEDNGFIFMLIKGPVTANVDYMTRFTDRMGETLMAVPEREGYFMGLDANSGRSGIILKPWSERTRGIQEIQAELQPRLDNIPGIQVQSFVFPSLPSGGDGPPVQFILKTTADYETLFTVLDQLGKAAQESGLLIFSDTDLRFDTPQYRVSIDSAKANQLGIRMSDIGSGLATLLGGNFVNRFSLQGRAYQVIPQVPRDFRLTPDWLTRYQLRTASGDMVPLSTVATVSRTTQPNALTQFQQLNSGTLLGAPFPGRTLGDVLDFLNAKAAELLPEGFIIDYAGESRQYVQEGSSLVAIFGFAMLVIFLVLAAQFESWRDPLIILVAVPLSVFGALLPLTFGLGSINIYTQVGLVTLIGLISKHGILMVEFANRVQISEGLNRRQSIVRAAAVRLRPIMMTTAAMVMGVVPLLMATGAGAESRFQMGLVIAAGMTIGTMFTLFVLPAVYVVLARKHYLHAAPAATPEATPEAKPAPTP
ncbi:MAG: multidrug efflux protein, partial [Alphaproteobacteria bacterium]